MSQGSVNHYGSVFSAGIQTGPRDTVTGHSGRGRNHGLFGDRAGDCAERDALGLQREIVKAVHDHGHCADGIDPTHRHARGVYEKYKFRSAVRSYIKVCGGAFLSVASHDLVISSRGDRVGTDLDGISCLKLALCHVPRPDQIEHCRTGAAAGYSDRFSGADDSGQVQSGRRFCLGHGHER